MCNDCGAVIAYGGLDSYGHSDNGDGWCSRCGAELRDHSDPGLPELPDWAKDPDPEPETPSSPDSSNASTDTGSDSGSDSGSNTDNDAGSTTSEESDAGTDSATE